MELKDYKREDRRLKILRALAAENDYAMSDGLIRMMLADWGHKESSDTIRTDIAWLDEQDLVQTREQESAIIVTAMPRGCEVADGSAVVPGVRRPRAGE